MSTNGIDMQVASTSATSAQRRFRFTGLAIRLLIAFVISWLIVMAFFVTGAVSH